MTLNSRSENVGAQLTQKYAVTNCNTPIERLKYERDVLGHSWRKIASGGDFGFIPARTLNSIYHGKRDFPKKYRARLGLFPPATVYVVTDGDVPPGTQVISASLCACGQWFVSNHPARKRCFICSPYRKTARVKL